MSDATPATRPAREIGAVEWRRRVASDGRACGWGLRGRAPGSSSSPDAAGSSRSRSPPLVPLLMHEQRATSSASASTRSSTCLLALGLNVAVGFAGLLSTSATSPSTASAPTATRCSRRTSSAFTGRHGSRSVVVIVVVAISRLRCSRLPSRRLVGRLPRDRDALLRLQFFVDDHEQRESHLRSSASPGLRRPDRRAERDCRHRSVRSLRRSHLRRSIAAYFYVALDRVRARACALPHFVDQSRTGRAWRSLREDPLAAEVMGMPVNRLKLLAFAFGAGRSPRSPERSIAALISARLPARLRHRRC